MPGPIYKLYGRNGEYMAACRYLLHAAELIHHLDEGAQIKFGHDVQLFRKDKEKLSTNEIVKRAHRREMEVQLLGYMADGKPYSIIEVVGLYPEHVRPMVKQIILDLGDSRREDRKLDLSRDDRPIQAIPEVERAMMPAETVGDRLSYYCVMQKRKKQGAR